MRSPFFCKREQEIDTRGAGGAEPEPFDFDAIAAWALPLDGKQTTAAEVNEAATALRIGALADHRTLARSVFASALRFPVMSVNVVRE
jgi:hypothetical protein